MDEGVAIPGLGDAATGPDITPGMFTGISTAIAPFAPWAAPIVSAFGSILGAEGASDSNEAAFHMKNLDFARQSSMTQQNWNWNSLEAQKNRDFQAAQAAQQMSFQERMANTQWQRGIADLHSAGMNPMLAYHQGGAASPAGASGSGSAAHANAPNTSSVYPWSSPKLQAMASAAQAAGMVGSVEKIYAEIDKLKAETETERQRPGEVAEHTTKMKYETRNLNQQLHNLISQQRLTQQQEDKVKHEVYVLVEQQGIHAAELMLKRMDMLLKEMSFPEAVAKSKAWATHYGQEYRPYLEDVAKGVGSAAAVRRFFGR